MLVLSDAGMPTVSDPGFRARRRPPRQPASTVTAIPGPSAVLTALAVSGLPTDRFTFEGFLPRKPGERVAPLRRLAAERRTMVFFEAPTRLAASSRRHRRRRSAPIAAPPCAASSRSCYEEVRRGTLAELAEWAEAGVRGEICIVVGGRGERSSPTPRARSDACSSSRHPEPG